MRTARISAPTQPSSPRFFISVLFFFLFRLFFAGVDGEILFFFAFRSFAGGRRRSEILFLGRFLYDRRSGCTRRGSASGGRVNRGVIRVPLICAALREKRNGLAEVV